MTWRLLGVALPVLLALLVPVLAFADERILSYDSQVDVRADGSLDVVERIRVRAEGSNIRRGIHRDFPTRYKDRRGNRVVVGFEVGGVQRDGRTEPWFTEHVANGVRVNTGGDDFLPVPAEYTYTLRYRTTRQLGFFADHDELYWNAIGHGWMFPIDAGSVEVRLPRPLPIAAMSAEGYSGMFGARGRDFTSTLPAPGIARWQLRRPLQPQEGLTVVLSFPKGLVAAPSRQQRLWWLLQDNRGVLIALAGLAGLLAFCIRRWRQLGRDPPAGTIIVRYDPPTGYSPAGLRYMTRMAYDTRCFSADLLASAVDGALEIHRDKHLLKDAWRLSSTGGDGAVATAEQRALLQRLFARGATTLELGNANAATMQAAIAQHSQALAKRFQPALFDRNGGSIGVAAVIAVLTAAGALILAGGAGIVLIIAVLAAMAVVLVVFANLIKAPTRDGRRLMDEIAGLKRYLEVADRDELASLSGPDAPPTLDARRYERLLPYAVALEVEDAWTKKFTLAVGAAAAAATTSAITWYHGGGSDIGSFARTIGSSLNSQISSSSTPPGSSSGGGGGGSSGGGGGGGGGGGR